MILVPTSVLIFMINFVGSQGANSYQAYSRSFFSDNQPGLAVDSDNNSCYKSGYGFQEWLVVDLGKVVTLTEVVVKGILQTSNVRVGNMFGGVGLREEFQQNGLCLLLDNARGEFGMMKETAIKCQTKMKGRYISIQLVDPSLTTQIVVCELNVV